VSLHRNIGAKRARDVRERLGLGLDGRLDDVLAVVEDAGGVPVLVARLGEGTAGAYDPSLPLIWVGAGQAVRRQRFTVAHEFGHHCCGHRERKVLDSVDDLAGRTGDTNEWQANAFAAEFLAPKVAVQAWVETELQGTLTLEVVCRLAHAFAISAPAALIRLRTVGLLADGERSDRLQAEIEAGDHRELERLLGLEEHQDTLARLSADSATRIPATLAQTPFGRYVAGTLSLDEAAALAGCPADRLAAAIEFVEV
jgi:Zn-dependent peptidase ImmA (M78 family)